MANVVNLNKFRKKKAEEDARKRADTNVRLHGRTGAERTREELRQQLLASKLDGARLTEPLADDDQAKTPEDPD